MLSCQICPLKKKGELGSVANKHGVEVVSLIAPTSENRIEMIAKDAEGFVYCVSSLGVTGMRSEIKTDIKSIVETIRKYTDIPVAVGLVFLNLNKRKQWLVYLMVPS